MEWLGKKVFIVCQGKQFTGEVIEEDQSSITIKDKFLKIVFFNKNNIGLLKEDMY